jgi:hypothetical protein
MAHKRRWISALLVGSAVAALTGRWIRRRRRGNEIESFAEHGI